MASSRYEHSGEASAGPGGHHREDTHPLGGLELTVQLTATLQKYFVNLQAALERLEILYDSQVQLWLRHLVAAINISYNGWKPHVKKSLGTTLKNLCKGLSSYKQDNSEAAVGFLVCLFSPLSLCATSC